MLQAERKVSRVNYSYTVSLPPEWVKKASLRGGDHVMCEIRKDGTLLLRKKEA